jgi:hypothetical protein
MIETFSGGGLGFLHFDSFFSSPFLASFLSPSFSSSSLHSFSSSSSPFFFSSSYIIMSSFVKIWANGLFHDANLPASVALSAKALLAAGIASTFVSPH